MISRCMILSRAIVSGFLAFSCLSSVEGLADLQTTGVDLHIDINKTSFQKDDALVITYTVINHGEGPFRLLLWGTDTGDSFQILDGEKQRVDAWKQPFVIVDPIAPARPKRSDYVKLLPGKSYSRIIRGDIHNEEIRDSGKLLYKGWFFKTTNGRYYLLPGPGIYYCKARYVMLPQWIKIGSEFFKTENIWADNLSSAELSFELASAPTEK